MVFPDRKKAASIIVGGMPEGSNPRGDDLSGDDPTKLADDVFAAIDNRDSAALVDAMKALFQHFDMEPDDQSDDD